MWFCFISVVTCRNNVKFVQSTAIVILYCTPRSQPTVLSTFTCAPLRYFRGSLFVRPVSALKKEKTNQRRGHRINYIFFFISFVQDRYYQNRNYKLLFDDNVQRACNKMYNIINTILLYVSLWHYNIILIICDFSFILFDLTHLSESY